MYFGNAFTVYNGDGHPFLKYSDWSTWRYALILEIITTFFLVYGILAIANQKLEQKEKIFRISIAVGVSVTFGIMLAGPITGGALNPARVLGPSIISGLIFEKGNFVYYLGPFLGAILAHFT